MKMEKRGVMILCNGKGHLIKKVHYYSQKERKETFDRWEQHCKNLFTKDWFVQIEPITNVNHVRLDGTNHRSEIIIPSEPEVYERPAAIYSNHRPYDD